MNFGGDRATGNQIIITFDNCTVVGGNATDCC